jgi:hypothetical protein
MKSLLKIATVLLLTLSFFSCSTDSEFLESLEGKTQTFDQLFERVSSMDIDVKDENVIYIDYTWNKSTDLVKVTQTVEKEPEFFIIEDSNTANKVDGDTYTVTCDNGGDGSDDWTETCDGKFSCGKLLYKCLNGEGCGTICTNRMAYAPQTKTFYLLKE